MKDKTMALFDYPLDVELNVPETGKTYQVKGTAILCITEATRCEFDYYVHDYAIDTCENSDGKEIDVREIQIWLDKEIEQDDFHRNAVQDSYFD